MERELLDDAQGRRVGSGSGPPRRPKTGRGWIIVGVLIGALLLAPFLYPLFVYLFFVVAFWGDPSPCFVCL